MRANHTLECLFLIAILLYPICIAGSAPSPPAKETLGIAPQDEGYYASKIIKCKDGSKKFTRDQLNDEFCDCPDGTDEPGTSACPEGKFYCRNTGHTPLVIFSSRVNDGICDCCDGSDEYDGRVDCSNTCWEAGKIARGRLKKKIATYQEGVAIRKQEVEKAKIGFAKDDAELSKLKNEEKVLKVLVQRLKEKREQIEKAEEQERLEREKEEQRLQELGKNTTDFSDETQAERLESVKQDITEDSGESGDLVTEDENVDTHKSSSDDDFNKHEVDENDGSVLVTEAARNEEATSHDAVKEEPIDTSSEGLSKEELGRLVASRWTGENVGHKTDGMDKNEAGQKDNLEFPESAEGEDYDGYNSEIDEDRHKYGDVDDEFQETNTHNEEGDDNFQHDIDYDPESEGKVDDPDLSTSWLDKIQRTVHNILNAVNIFKSPVNTSEAAHVRKEFEDASSKLSRMQSRISCLTEKLKQDFGTEKEFYSFYDHCFEFNQNKYIYKVCPFKQASQVEGHSTTRLGHWEKFEETYRVMQFLHGDRCWNGPDRSLKVRLRCGLKNELTDVDEPSRCEYTAFLSTPVLCKEEKLKELQQKLELMNSGGPLPHDEL